ncbi:Protein of unknown function [Pyronema omphalodes CBS 100304]|uniref:Uncharacterized protein n=1 Tax=Pyronema omphalodes (strain CBS 100304) TaxID=1076935 RepID=U4LJ63_PYROM|nr:Protein of unknown function [Pyronema omphalodes CBS 100304]
MWYPKSLVTAEVKLEIITSFSKDKYFFTVTEREIPGEETDSDTEEVLPSETRPNGKVHRNATDPSAIPLKQSGLNALQVPTVNGQRPENINLRPENRPTSSPSTSPTTSNVDEDGRPKDLCTGCEKSLKGTTAYRCTFPVCQSMVCESCSSILSRHPQDGGAWGDIHELKVLLGLTPATETSGIVQPLQKKSPASGAAMMLKIQAKRDEEEEFKGRWGCYRN